jgi:hypothetical protein
VEAARAERYCARFDEEPEECSSSDSVERIGAYSASRLGVALVGSREKLIVLPQ